MSRRAITTGVSISNDCSSTNALVNVKFCRFKTAQMPDISYEILTRFFQNHLPFLPTARQVTDFQADLRVVSPFLMEASLIEVKAGTQPQSG
jgi:hypothetical protein